MVWKHNKDFKILLVYPNIQISALMPLSMGLFTALLKREGFNVQLFDCTFYIDGPTDDTNQEKVNNNQVLNYDWSERGVVPKTGMIKDFNKQVEEFKPDLVTVSVLESTYDLGLELMKTVPKKNKTFKTMFGSVFATYAPDKVIVEDVVDIVCRGEGEVPLVELCKRMAAGESINDTPNLWIKENGNVIKNGMAPAVDINSLPFPDWDLFEPQSIYRPMQGKIYRAVGMENQRGCPYTCAYCNSPSNNIDYKNEVASRLYRKKTIQQIREF